MNIRTEKYNLKQNKPPIGSRSQTSSSINQAKWIRQFQLTNSHKENFSIIIYSSGIEKVQVEILFSKKNSRDLYSYGKSKVMWIPSIEKYRFSIIL